LKKITLLFVLIGTNSFSQIINTAPYILTVAELKQWTTAGPTASTDLISTVDLAPRFTNTATQMNPALSNDMKIAYLPDGMNNFGNYFGEQSQFNLYNFTHWAYIDKLVWFGGTASQTIQLPSSPWANAAHKNGVKIFGNVFFAPTAFGGSTATLTNFLEQDVDGNFVSIPKMIEMMQYYNFDGWFINQETATNSATAQLMYAFVRELTAQAEALGKEVMWYDAMTLSGSVGWQNRLNTNNSVFVQRDADADISNGYETKVSSSIFINFFWSGVNPPNASRTRATTIGRSSFDVFTGIDIWPGRNQGDFELAGNTFMTSLHESNETTPVTSLGIFAPNCVFNNSTYTNFNNDPTDFASFYNAENKLFAGDDVNPQFPDANGFKGLSNWVPEASVITSLPFETNFCTGHGVLKYTEGVLTSNESWHNMNLQDILPTWQFAFSQPGLVATLFGLPYNFGNGLLIQGDILSNTPIDMLLYKTQLTVTDQTTISIKYFHGNFQNANMKWVVIFADNPTQKVEFPIAEGTSLNWNTASTLISDHAGREIAAIGFRFFSETNAYNYSLSIGNLKIYNDPEMATSFNPKTNAFVTVSYPVQPNNPILFTINWPNARQLKYSVSNMGGKVIMQNTITFDKTSTHPLNTNGLAAGVYLVKFCDDKNRIEVKKIRVK
jgi:endo-beta-N-acetylglucosaminidase D